MTIAESIFPMSVIPAEAGIQSVADADNNWVGGGQRL